MSFILWFILLLTAIKTSNLTQIDDEFHTILFINMHSIVVYSAIIYF